MFKQAKASAKGLHLGSTDCAHRHCISSSGTKMMKIQQLGEPFRLGGSVSIKAAKHQVATDILQCPILGTDLILRKRWHNHGTSEQSNNCEIVRAEGGTKMATAVV